jgi:cytochrome c2
MWLAGVRMNAAETSGVQVAGFERFGRHSEMDDSVAGRLLITELGCTACHATSDETLKPKSGPDLSSVGVRLSRDWIAKFVAAPASVQPGTTMPNLLDQRSASERDEIAKAMAAYLSSLRKPLAEVKATGRLPAPHQFWLHGDVDRGRRLFHQVGCVACHAADPEYELAPVVASPTDQLLDALDADELADLGLSGASRPGPIQSLGIPAEKYSAHSLTSFLLDPAAVRPAGRMPNLNLLPTEAADIAAYLISQRSQASIANLAPREPGSDAADMISSAAEIAEGRDWFVKLNCGNCHSGADAKTNNDLATLPALSQLPTRISQGRGCVGEQNQETSHLDRPHYVLDEQQRAAILAAIAPPKLMDSNDRLLLSLLQLNCLACHQRDALGGVARDRRAYFETVGNVDLGDEGRFPPPLSRVEAKLQPTWLTRVLQGTGTIRPHMLVRMPKVPNDWVKLLANDFRSALLASSTKLSAEPLTETQTVQNWPQAVDTKATEAGRAMMDAGCVQCHLFRGESLPGVSGVDLSGIGDRMQPDWFHALLLEPGAVKPRTRMPNFFPDRKSQHPELLEGDPDRQIAAMWGYLSDLAKQSLPAKIEAARAADYELRPVDRPIILRTFMRDAGTHAIAVGFPQSVHIAVDSTEARLAAVWRGRFLDAQGTWFVRSAPPADPLGESLKTLSSLPSFITAPDSENSRTIGITMPFRGYRIDDRGVPTFQYRFGAIDIEDTIEPDTFAEADSSRASGLVRRLVAKSAAESEQPPNAKSPLLFRLIAGRQLKLVTNASGSGQVEASNEDGWRVRVAASVAQSATMQTEKGLNSWVLPIDLQPTHRTGDSKEGTQGEMAWELRYLW